MQLGDFDASCHAQCGVEVGQRFIEEEYARIADDGAADGNTLALAAGELLGQTIKERCQLQHLSCLQHTLFGFLR